MDEWEQLQSRLVAAGVDGVEDLGLFVNNPQFFRSARFDERAAMPVLMEALPELTDPKLVATVAGHLRRPWARPHAFISLLSAFEAWAQRSPVVGWQLGDAVGTTATAAQVEILIRISRNKRYGTARQMVVHALGRFKRHSGVSQALLQLIEDPDVALHAMGALRRVLGSSRALEHLERVEREHRGTQVGEQAAREAKKARRSLT